MNASDLFVLAENELTLTVDNLPFEWKKQPEQCPTVAENLNDNFLPIFKPFQVKAVKSFIFNKKEFYNNNYLKYRVQSSNYEWQAVLAVSSNWWYAMRLNACTVERAEITALDFYNICFFVQTHGKIIENQIYTVYPIIQYIDTTDLPDPDPFNPTPPLSQAKCLNSEYITGHNAELLGIFQADEIISEQSFFSRLMHPANAWRGNSQIALKANDNLISENFAKTYRFSGIYGKDTGDFNILVAIDDEFIRLHRKTLPFRAGI